MSCNQTFRSKPYDVVPASAVFELTILADNGVPTAGDSTVHNVIFAPTTGINAVQNRFGPEEVMIKGRFTGTDKANADCTVTLWAWDKDSSQWYAANRVPIVGTAVLSLTKGSMAKCDCDPSSRLGYLEVNGIGANQDIVLMVTKRN